MSAFLVLVRPRLAAIFDTFSGHGDAPLPVCLSIPGAVLELVAVSGPGAAPVPATICGHGAALGRLITVSGRAAPFATVSLLLVRPWGSLPSL